MPNDTEVEQLLEHIQKALNVLEDIQNVECIINKLDTDQNRKLLKKVKHVVNECYSKVGNIREKVNKAYKRVKIRDISESNTLEDTERQSPVEASEGLEKENSNNSETSVSIIDETVLEESVADCELSVSSNTNEISEHKRSEETNFKSNENNLQDTQNIQSENEKADKSVSVETSVQSADNITDTQNIQSENEKADESVTLISSELDKSVSVETSVQSAENITDAQDIQSENEKADESVTLINSECEKSVSVEASVQSAENITVGLSPAESSAVESSNQSPENVTVESSREESVENLNVNSELVNSSSEEASAQFAENKKASNEQDSTSKSSNKKIDSEIISDNSKVGDENVELSDKKDQGNITNNEGSCGSKRPLIKLVDISKLMAPDKTPLNILSPKPKKSVSFENSIIVLSSSDDEAPKKKVKDKDQSHLKSTTRKKATVSSDSDSDDSGKIRKSKRSKKLEKLSRKNKTSSREIRYNRRNVENGKKVDQHSDSDSDEYKSSRKDKQSKDRKRIRKPSSESENSVDESSNKGTELSKDDSKSSIKDKQSKNRKRIRKASSESDNSLDESSNKGTELSKDDSKLNSKVVIKLPKYKCEDLTNLFSKTKSDAVTNSKDTEPNNKRIKLTLKLNKSQSKDEDEQKSSENSENDHEELDSSLKNDIENQIEILNSMEVDENNTEGSNDKNESQCKLNGNMLDKENDDATQSKDQDEEVEGDKTVNDSDSDSDDFARFSKKKDKSNAELLSDEEDLPVKRKAKKRMKKNAVLSDSDTEQKDNENEKRSSDESSDSESEDSQKPKKTSRKRIKNTNDSSSDDDDKSTRKHIRKVLNRDSLSETTKKAEADEKARKARIIEKQKKYNQIFQLKADATVDKVVLDFDEENEKPLLSVHKRLVKHLKPHQVQGVKFMWDACFESLKRAQKKTGSGCILAHCMGLGKTLQVIALSHTLLANSDETKVEKIMVVCPVNTVLNWKSEFTKWAPKDDEIEVYDLVSGKTSSVNQERGYKVREWHENGGVLIIGYNMFRTLTNPDNKGITKKLRATFQEGLVDPGPDLVVCDEGHLLKNEKTSLSISMNRIKTARRIVLTGTPLQNNLREYWCMVQFIKPNLLGTYKEYLNRFVNPITNGQYTDSTPHDISIMRRRAHVLHKLLDGVVQRQDYDVLAPYLPPKYEYVLFIKLTEVQIKLYKHYITHLSKRNDGPIKTSFLFADFQQLQRICTHPRILMERSIEDKDKLVNESESEGSLKDFIDDGSDDDAKSTSSSDSSDSSNSNASVRSNSPKKKKGKTKSGKRMTRAQAASRRETGEKSDSDIEIEGPKEWWQEFISQDELDNINLSGKMFLLFEILKECEEIGDKILVFSQSLYTLNCIEYFLQTIDEATQIGDTSKTGGHSGSWAIGLDYFRLDGSSSCDNRATWCDAFNNSNNPRARLFLISTKAGGLGINLVAANRVIIFDVSWNPSHDIQSIYRVYRFGQTKPSYIYRFVNYGTMEMKIYERQVTKQAISKRVIDEQQIDRHYSHNDIQELYQTDLEPTDRPIPMVPKDVLLGEMLQKYDKTLFKFHEHQSLLENKQDEELNEEERKAAWEEFENEKKLRTTVASNFGMGLDATGLQNRTGLSIPLVHHALENIVRKDNPTWSLIQVKGIIPALVHQLQVQISENNFTLMTRVQQEIQVMQAIQAQQIREQYMRELRMRQMLHKQQLTNQMMGSMNISPEEIHRLQMATAQDMAGVSTGSFASTSGDVIDLND